MSLTFASVLIILVIFPGLFYRKGYYSYPFSKKWIPENLASDLIYSILPSVLLHALYAYIISNWITFHQHTVDFNLLIKFLWISESGFEETCRKNLEEHIFCIFWYHISLWIFSFILGQITRYGIKGFKLDQRFNSLRFNNEWHYILSGEIMYKINGKYFSDLKYVTVLLKSGKSNVTYKGMLVDYQLGAKGTLDSICLRDTRRMIWRANQQPEFQEIDGDIFVIPATEILNLNIDYLYVTEPGEQDTSEGVINFWMAAIPAILIGAGKLLIIIVKFLIKMI